MPARSIPKWVNSQGIEIQALNPSAMYVMYLQGNSTGSSSLARGSRRSTPDTAQLISKTMVLTMARMVIIVGVPTQSLRVASRKECIVGNMMGSGKSDTSGPAFRIP